MDISKLPRLSQTTNPAPAEAGGPADAGPAEAGSPVSTTTLTPQTAPTAWCRQCNAPNAATAAYCSGCGAPLRTVSPVGVGPGVGAEVWVSAIVGIVLMLIGLDFAKWAVTTMTGGTYDTGMTWGAPVPGLPNQHAEGSPIGYWQLDSSLQDAALFLFGFAMMLEAIVLLVVHSQIRSKLPLLAVALTITLIATGLNVVVAAKLFSAGIVPLMSLLAIAFGGYIAAYEWKLFRYFQATPKTA